MNFRLSKRLVARGIFLRFIAVFFFLTGIISVWSWQSQTEQIPTRFLVQLAPELQEIPAPESIIQNKNLSDYDLGVNFSNCAGVTWAEIKQCAEAQDKGREFIWNHWKEKKRGYIVFEWSGVDTASDFHIFIEPDEKGNWHIVSKRKLPASYMARNDSYQIEVEDALFMRRKPITKNDDRNRLGKFYLLFLDKDENELSTL